MFTRDGVLGGLHAHRGSTVPFAIEGATAHLVAASRINRPVHTSERTTAERPLILGLELAAAVCVALEILVLTGQDWFAGPIGIGGALAGRSVLFEAPVEGDGGERTSAVVPAGPWRELPVWPHEVTADGWSTQRAADVDIDGRLTPGTVDRGDIVVSIDGTPTTIHVTLTEAARA